MARNNALRSPQRRTRSKMKYLPSLMGVGQLSGKAGSTVASRNKAGSYLRTKVMPKLVQNAATSSVRGNLSTLASTWRTLTDIQRAGWSGLGDTIVRTDSLGATYTLTGFQAYLLINRNLFTIGLTAIATAPAYSPPASVLTVTVTATSV